MELHLFNHQIQKTHERLTKEGQLTYGARRDLLHLSKIDPQISMTEENHCYENAIAERVNGILKDEFNLDMEFKTKKDAYKAFLNAVMIYNNYRPHTSLNYATPCEIHSRVA